MYRNCVLDFSYLSDSRVLSQCDHTSLMAMPSLSLWTLNLVLREPKCKAILKLILRHFVTGHFVTASGKVFLRAQVHVYLCLKTMMRCYPTIVVLLSLMGL